MGLLTLVRHGQASFFGANYDELSPAGHAQARALGEHWVRHGVAFDAVYVGPRRRHRQTLDSVAAVYAAHGRALPAAREVGELDEHDGLTVIRHALGAGGPRAPAQDPGEAGRELLLREFMRHYHQIMRDWARGTLVVPDVEPWPDFRARTLRALDLMCAAPGDAVAFTSGGFVSSAAGWLLGLDEDRVIELSAVLKNTALTEVRHSGRRRGLTSFNTLPHLPDARAATTI